MQAHMGFTPIACLWLPKEGPACWLFFPAFVPVDCFFLYANFYFLKVEAAEVDVRRSRQAHRTSLWLCAVTWGSLALF